MQNIDYSNVDPIKVAEAKRRVALLEKYTQLLDPTRADTEKFAKKLDISRMQFSRMVRRWRDHRDPSLLVVAKRGTSTRDYGLTERAIEIAYACIAAANPNATVKEITAETKWQCNRQNLHAPSPGTVWNYMCKTRATATTDVGPPRIVIERIWTRMPIVDKPITYMPTVLVAMLLPERLIVSYDISIDQENPPSVAKVVKSLALARSKGAKPRPLLLSSEDRRMASEALQKAGLSQVSAHDRSILKELSNAFGRQLGPLKLIHRRGMAKCAKPLGVMRHENPFTRRQAIELISAAIQTHNNARETQAVEFDITLT